MQKARDAKIKSNIAQIQTALELYRSDCGNYPDSITSGGSLTSSTATCSGYSGSQITYLQTLPSFPSSANFSYTRPNGSQTYRIVACLEREDESEGTIEDTSCPSDHDRAFRADNP
jgi:hypothetical protein